MKTVLAYPSYHDIEKGCARLVYQLATMDDESQVIIGLSRGGLIPAVIMSHIMDLPMIPVAYSSTSGNGDDLNHENHLIAVKEHNVLIVDDICDSGKTMAEVAAHYTAAGHIVTTAALYVKESSVIMPNEYWQCIPSDAPWIIFPWEL